MPPPPSRLSALAFVNPQDDDANLGAGLRTVPVGDRPAELPGEPGPLDVRIAGAGRMHTLPEWNAATTGTSLLVLVGGRVVHEWYADGLSASDRFLGASMTKSALSHLVGIAVREGALGLDEAVTDRVPELAGSGYARCRVRDVLTMTSGVDWVEDHRDPSSLASRLTACFGADGGDSRSLLAQVPAGVSPGIRYEYCTADSQVLDWVRERATGADYVTAIGELWRLLGGTSEATVGVDREGVAMAGGALAATARDWARIGLLHRDGTWAGARLLDEEWVAASTGAAYAFTEPGRLPSTITTHAGFGYHWWPTDTTGLRSTADGSRGQFCYVDRERDVVVVKTSQWPYEDPWSDRQSRDLSYLGLASIAEAAVQIPSKEEQ